MTYGFGIHDCSLFGAFDALCMKILLDFWDRRRPLHTGSFDFWGYNIRTAVPGTVRCRAGLAGLVQALMYRSKARAATRHVATLGDRVSSPGPWVSGTWTCLIFSQHV